MGRAVTEEETVLADIASGADKIILDIIKNGQVVRDERGNLICQHPSAAMLSMIYKRLKDKNINTLPVPGSVAAKLEEEAEARGLRITPDTPEGEIPPLDTEHDDAATA